MSLGICIDGGYLVQDEQDLVHRAQNGDKEAFTELYETYFSKLYRYVVVRIANRAEAEDMTQQVFVKAYKSITSYQWRGVPFSAWLFRIAHNLVVDFFRKESRRPTVPFEESLVISDDDVQQVVERRLDVERVMAATQQLTAAQREVVSLRFAGGLAIAEVARVMGKSEGAVKALQHSAIAALRRILLVGENGVKG
jgi:RNA polymerase sigma-70 factor (ECF subfamily)